MLFRNILIFILHYLKFSVSVDLGSRLACAQEGCRVNSDSLRFMLIGDTGGNPKSKTTKHQLNVAKSMTEIWNSERSNFVINLGDNFYFDGVGSVGDPRFKETFEVPYSGLDLPWYIIAGNHDHLGNVQAQIQYTNYSTKWTFPNYYYSLKYTFGNPGVNVVFVLIDTIRLCGNNMDSFSQKFIEWIFHDPNEAETPANPVEAEEQFSWIQEELKKHSSADYIFVGGHYPIYSASSHGGSKCLLDRLDPILRNSGVTAYFSGHDHDLQHIEVNQGGSTMDYIVSGAGSRGDPSDKHEDEVPRGSVLFRYPTWGVPFDVFGWFNHGGFINVNIDKNSAHFVFYNEELERKYETHLRPRQKF
ncbi:hypothetical protein FO519_003411 [Halicephalobus sp. NKZ332]|nr:hypothetical protein FO519_003411 [Halicephalobus sp. NKZ332]